MCSVEDPPVHGRVPTLANQFPKYGQIVTLGCPNKFSSNIAMILWGQNTCIMPVHRRKQPLVPGMSHTKNLLIKDLLSTSTLRVYQKHTGVVMWMWHFRKIYT